MKLLTLNEFSEQPAFSLFDSNYPSLLKVFLYHLYT